MDLPKFAVVLVLLGASGSGHIGIGPLLEHQRPILQRASGAMVLFDGEGLSRRRTIRGGSKNQQNTDRLDISVKL